VDSLRDEVDAAGESADELFEQLRLFVESNSTDRTDYERSLRITWQAREHPGWSRVETAWNSLRTRLSDTADALDDLLISVQDIEGVKPQLREALAVEIPSLLGRTDELIRQLDSAVNQPDSSSVYWITVNRHTGAVGVHSAPLEVRGFLENALFSANDSVVLTGATLTSEGSFHYIKDRLGAEGARTVVIDSPFDYLSSTLVYLPNDIPDPQHPAYQQAVESALIDICRETRGRTLVLFTSHASLRQTQAAIHNPLEEEGVLVLGQGIDGSPRQLLAAFKGNPNTVLLGTASFWEGIDVVGDGLAVLVITRLPFNVPTEPTFEARSELLDDPFNQYAVPQATIRFKQGFGRLIRSHKDRGIVVVMDRRVQSKRYGSAFLESIPTCTVRRGSSRELPAALKGWLSM
jgi:DNA polymerase-3 subunit epsilon/ATP-dependent DNA helicase DinG